MTETLVATGYEPVGPVETPSGFSVEEVIVAGDRGPCGGVNMAVETAFEVLGIVAGREPVYTTHPIVHNKSIMEVLTDLGLIVESDINKIPVGSIRVMSAHTEDVEQTAISEERGMLNIDTGCLLVYKVQRAGLRAVKEGKHVIYVGTKKHPEPEGVLSVLPEGSYTFVDIDGDDQTLPHHGKVDFVSLNQTTLSTVGVVEKIKSLRELNPSLQIPDPEGICYATDNRQNAVRRRLEDQENPIHALLVVGSQTSHNSKELRNVGKNEAKIPSFLVDGPEDIDPLWFSPSIKRLMITSGASVLDEYLWRTVKYFTDRGTIVKFIPSTEKKPRINPETEEPVINSETGEVEYEERFFVGPDLTPLWERMAEKYGATA
ncbi:MAG: hypothetical protein HYV38_03550 [Candidatus Levybacteria bacterium]|nr:hypothetical protein [Candidatus Levybacteria bacterium]